MQGSNTVDVRQTDVAGNVSGLNAFNFTLDTVAPTIAITTPIAGDNVVNAAEAATGFAINGTTTGIADGQTATIVLVNSANAVVDTYTPIVGGNAWSITVTSTQAQALANGSYTVKADVSDVAGNAAGEASQALTVNKAALSIAITTPDCRRQYCQRGGGGGGILDPGHHHRGCRRADRDDHDRQQCQHGVVHLQPRCQRQCLVGDGAGHRSSGRWQLYHQSRCVGSGRQPGAGSDANSDGR